jgi:hypothetical protein
MHIHHFSDEQVDAYLLDLMERLKSLKAGLPTVWFPIGRSGDSVVKRMEKLFPPCDLPSAPVVIRVNVDRDKKEHKFTVDDLAKYVTGQNVLVLDSLVHTGQTMAGVVDEILRFAPASLYTYGTVIKMGSSLIPSSWGVAIADHDRALLLLQKLPNNRLNKRNPSLHLRRLAEADCDRPTLQCELESMDRTKWGDRYFDMCNSESGRVTYLLESSVGIVGYVTINFRKNNRLMVDEVAVDKAHRNNGHCGALLRWAETLAKLKKCIAIDLWAIDNKVPMYRDRYGFSPVAATPIKTGGETYILMSRSLNPEDFDDDLYA